MKRVPIQTVPRSLVSLFHSLILMGEKLAYVSSYVSMVLYELLSWDMCSIGIMGRNILGWYYWPGRMQDIARWCLSCGACQRLGPRRISTQTKPIMALQPMDLMGWISLGQSPHIVEMDQCTSSLWWTISVRPCHKEIDWKSSSRVPQPTL